MDKQVAIVILTKNNPKLLETCLTSVAKHTITTSYKIYICDTGSDETVLNINMTMAKRLFDNSSCKMFLLDKYSFGQNNNEMIMNHVQEDWVLLCNDDIELKSNCVDEMYDWATSQEHVGSVGCRLVFPNETIQHGGQIAYKDENGLLQCSHRGYGEPTKYIYYGVEKVVGNTAALMLTNTNTFKKFTGFDERFEECWEDIQLNMRYILGGYNNWYLDHVHAVHRESSTRKQDLPAEMKLTIDYAYKLKPWFDNLSSAEQSKILNYQLNN